MFAKDVVRSVLSIDRACVFTPNSLIPSQDEFLTGRLHLHLSQAISVKNISAKLIGRLKIPREDTFTTSFQGGITYEKTQVLATSKTRKTFEMPAGTYEFPIQLPLEQRMMDSLMGPQHEYHFYGVHITLERRFASDITISRPVKVYRSPSLHQIDLENQFPQYLEGDVNESLHYRVSIPSQDIPFGSSFPVDVQLASYRKNLTPGSIKLSVMEKHQLQIALTASETVRCNSTSFFVYKSHSICSHEYDEKAWTKGESDLLDLEWTASSPVHLPRVPQSCTQSVHSKPVQIKHTLCFEVDFTDEGGKVTKISGTVPFNVYMSPYAVMENGTVYWQNLQELKYDEDEAPPLYGEHLADAKVPIEASCPSLNSITTVA